MYKRQIVTWLNTSQDWMFKIGEATVVFLLFFVLVFRRLYYKPVSYTHLTVNDLPIRMYGVVPVFVTNSQTVLQPQIQMPEVLRPETNFNVTVSEDVYKRQHINHIIFSFSFVPISV